MPVYTYRGTNRGGGAVSGEVTATSKAELQNILRRQQITATKMSEKGKEFTLCNVEVGRMQRSNGAETTGDLAKRNARHQCAMTRFQRSFQSTRSTFA